MLKDPPAELVESFGDTNRSQDQHLYTFIQVGRLTVPMGLQIDQLSISFVLLITGVGSLIHLYAVGYMRGDERYREVVGKNVFDFFPQEVADG